MSIIDPLSCGFARIAAYTIFRSKEYELERNTGECSAKFKTRELTHKYTTFQNVFKDHKLQFLVEYQQFTRPFQKILNTISAIGKTKPLQKKEILDSFSLEKWKELCSTKKKLHSLRNCRGCVNNEIYNKLLSYFPAKGNSGKQKKRILHERNGALLNRTTQVYNYVDSSHSLKITIKSLKLLNFLQITTKCIALNEIIDFVCFKQR